MSNGNVLGRLVVHGERSSTEMTLPYALLGMTVVTGLVDAVSFLRTLVNGSFGFSCRDDTRGTDHSRFAIGYGF